MKIYTGENIHKAIAENRATTRAAKSGPYIVIWPAPEPFMIPRLPRYAYVFTALLTAKPRGTYPGGAYSLKRYRVQEDAVKLPRKYRDILRPENYVN